MCNVNFSVRITAGQTFKKVNECINERCEVKVVALGRCEANDRFFKSGYSRQP